MTDRDEHLWSEVRALETVIQADANAAYHRELARSAEAVAHYVVTKIWPAHRRDELEQYRLPGAVSESPDSTPASATPPLAAPESAPEPSGGSAGNE